MSPPSFGTMKGMKPEPTRLRQVALVVRDLGETRRILVSCLFFFLFSFFLWLDWVGFLWCDCSFLIEMGWR